MYSPIPDFFSDLALCFSRCPPFGDIPDDQRIVCSAGPVAVEERCEMKRDGSRKQTIKSAH